MPTNGIRLAYKRAGRGERVLLIMGQAAGLRGHGGGVAGLLSGYR
jgi:hypothetical protein